MRGCERCEDGWVVVALGAFGTPDTLRPCEGCRFEAFDAWRNGKFMPNRVSRASDYDHDPIPAAEAAEKVFAEHREMKRPSENTRTYSRKNADV